jgi:hypothetical protein
MRCCLRRRRGYNASGADGAAASRDHSNPGSSFPFWAGLFFVFAVLMGTCDASDIDVDLTTVVEDGSASDSGESVSSTATTQPAGPPDVSESDDHQDDNNPLSVEEFRRKASDEHEAGENARQALLENNQGSKMVFHNRIAGTKYSILHPVPSSCICTGTAPESDCHSNFIDVHWATMCKTLRLNPAGSVRNDTTEEYVDLTYPWDEKFEEGEVVPEFDDQSAYDDNPDQFAWWEHCQAVMRMPLHRVGVHEYDMSGSPLRGGVHVQEYECNLREVGDEEGQQAGARDYDGDAIPEFNEGEDDPDDADSEVSTDDADCNNSDSDDNYEDVMHREVDTFLRFGVYPMDMCENFPNTRKSVKVGLKTHGDDTQ